jgi:hypothetical protein
MFPTWCYILPFIIFAVVIGVVSIAVWEAVWFVIHHWAWIGPHLAHAIHWYLLGT